MRWRLLVIEAWLVQRLLASPTFHRAVRRVHKRVEEARRGEKLYDPSEMGGTQVDAPSGWSLQKFIQNFREELKDQFRGATKK
ncbi:hypothetical protein NA56DRAFT_711354 [Hyaloscypha hepaticicola]|uniref:Uncharacterized protein n=1 Tax=Hyaloscypha hepaticicola TaxID=2082293 RepID=A0A2J6PJ03_9HELO|nr:hypothetical protein NA56DRAFT_711354 [Hyaloscypha hepaticicola]